ncbi:pyridoxal 5'-phosphate synthase glutaminase subunit PdxT [Egibacter rhizosphaerae]|uniref:Pyridoxal 5'-phosphate synthase subunit PdxT n=1 Tax=Egibacter rhizosphaerae TaxID=1670831 RepID=A0A411YJU5_9ACTN|nr:pyridoxal 5'-phosphate synthase glutaminase subunit PdxT [Egibacter rhizosphaerae]QBI21463.1 pyridoxal 5'-phosphate synthase glutaminase subunit PdxT [Egibacter rhizosphaerae]
MQAAHPVPGARIPGESLVPDRGPHHRPPAADGQAPRIGVLALQGDVLEHLRLIERAGAVGVPVRREDELATVDGLVLPGGESTTIGLLLDRTGLAAPVQARLAEGLPVLGTCAGAILLAREPRQHDGTPTGQWCLGALDVAARRNAFGRQVASFEADLDVAGLTDPMRAVFIRAPWFEDLGAGVEVLATVATDVGARVVVVRQGPVLASAFHPELSDDPRLHRLLVDAVVTRDPA